jgi:hypothetical protein
MRIERNPLPNTYEAPGCGVDSACSLSPIDPKDRSIYAAVSNAISLFVYRIAQSSLSDKPLPKIHVNANFNRLRPQHMGGEALTRNSMVEILKGSRRLESLGS